MQKLEIHMKHIILVGKSNNLLSIYRHIYEAFRIKQKAFVGLSAWSWFIEIET